MKVLLTLNNDDESGEVNHMTFNPDISKKPLTTRPSSSLNQRQRIKVTIPVTVKVLDDVKPEQLSQGAAYAFSKGGAFLGKTNLDQKGTGQIELNLPVLETAQSLRLIIGPSLAEKQSIPELLRLGGEQAYLQIPPKTIRKEIAFQVSSKQVLCWILSMCTVRGKVQKRIVSGGITMDLPVCGATVEIYEVDPVYLLIPKLPIEVIEHIREFIIKPPPPFPPIQPIERTQLIGPVPPQPLIIGNTKMTELRNSSQKTQLLMLPQKMNLPAGEASEIYPNTVPDSEDLQKLPSFCPNNKH